MSCTQSIAMALAHEDYISTEPEASLRTALHAPSIARAARRTDTNAAYIHIHPSRPLANNPSKIPTSPPNKRPPHTQIKKRCPATLCCVVLCPVLFTFIPSLLDPPEPQHRTDKGDTGPPPPNLPRLHLHLHLDMNGTANGTGNR